MEKHLQAYINHFQNNWIDLLPIVKFATNADLSASTKILLFQAMRKYILRMSFDTVDLSKESTRKQLANSKA